MKRFQKNISQLLDDALSLLYPRLCFVCNSQVQQKDFICISCEHQLPKTHYHLLKENPFTAKFYGRVPIVFGAAYYLHGTNKGTRQLLHQFKYNNKPQLGYWLGQEYGEELKKNSVFSRIDKIVPVPLHPKKLFQRGYNQSERLASGLASALGKDVDTTSFIRKKYTPTQTRKSRIGRLQNVASAFDLSENSTLDGKHILLVDDVLTTGATLEACANTILQKYPNVTISMVTLAIGE